MNTPLENLIAITVLFGPILLVVAFIIWYNVTGRGVARLHRKREQEVETQTRLGVADEAVIQRVADKIISERT
ncbi:hypothetical protein [Arthrobacter sp. AL12]|uniref:hypothetical protein n=1 Tax=Arthrobacter sp. AL12 TaxID=3042241 RepID=UPI00249AE9FC|nr:hypothetical protein [Arthrobacter sp. AL12]MDI3211748.1 hypothetical protein [Arthrobacter sp. AL12]